MIVVDPGSQSALTARRVARIARDHRKADVLIVGNKITGAEDRRLVEKLLGESLDAVVPADPAVAAAERTGAALLDDAPDSVAVRTIEDLARVIEGRRLSKR